MGSYKHPLNGSAISKKDAKKIRRKMRRGETITSPGERKLAQEENERRMLHNRETKKQSPIPVPRDVSLDKLEDYAPALSREVREHKVIRTKQTDTPYRARAIWFNDLDQKHTFHKKYRQSKVLFSILVHRLIKGEVLHHLELLFLAACLERASADEGLLTGDAMFTRREAFIKAWLGSDCDLYVFSKTDLAHFSRVKRDLRARLSDVTDEPDSAKFQKAPVTAFTEELPNMLEKRYPGSDNGSEASDGEGGCGLLAGRSANKSTLQEMMADYDKLKDQMMVDTASCDKASALLDRLRADKDQADVQGLVEAALEAERDGGDGDRSVYVVRR